MIRQLLRLWLALALILAASAVLLLTDRERPRGVSRQAGPASPTKARSVALFQHVSQKTLDEGARGVLAALAINGYREGSTLSVHRFCAEGDAATSSTIARALLGGDDDLIVTLSTPSLQAVAAANRDARRPHIFGMVSDPIVAGVGISRDDPKKHPPYMTGIGTMQPVADAFRLARRLAPGLKTVGVAWNPSEANSEACTKVARTTCKELGIELLEANVDGSAGVRESVASLVGRGAEAIWVGGDNTVLASIDAVIGPARSGGVPVFTSIPGNAERGALFDLGADYYRVGEMIGLLATRVLNGESTADMPILYEVSPEIWINPLALKSIGGGWTFPKETEANADVVIEKDGPVRRHPRAAMPSIAPSESRPSHTWKIGVAAFNESTILEDAIVGLRQGLKDAGLVEGRDFAADVRTAQGDIATLNAMFDELSGDDSDVVVTFSTPALQSAMRKVTRKPIVFSTVLDPFAAGAGKTDKEHRPNVTGAYLDFPYAPMAEQVRAVFPKARRVGTVFAPGEVNSVVARQRFADTLKSTGLELVSLPANGPSEVSDAALTLCQSGIDVVCQISDNLSNASFPAIARACEMAKMPLFTFSPTLVKTGAVLGIGSDFSANGRDSGLLVAEVIRGKDPSSMPFRATAKILRSVNLDTARRLGLTISPEWVKSADLVIPEPQSTH
jgi:ABC-type uncharacterized transport system substrate-binding protein